MIIAYIRITGFSPNRWLYPGHSPLSNPYESSMFLSRSLSLIHTILEVQNKSDWLGIITAPSATLTHASATPGIPKEMQQSTVLVPALQSHRLMMHVSMMMLSHATLPRGSPSAIAFSCMTSKQKSIFPLFHCNTDSSIRSFFSKRNLYLNEEKGNNLQKSFSLLSIDSRKWKFTQQLDHWSYRIISLGSPLLTIGIPSGAVWANEAWGSHWSRDPKETRAPITWLISAIHLHTRTNKGWQGKEPAIVAPSGFFIVRIRYSGVNLSGKGLHSYGWLI
nr:cytochrome c heme attachment protein [Takakia lepidozioides]